IVQPTFSEYADACRMHGHRVTSLYRLPAESEGYRLPEEVRMLWLCNPNNPTGTVVEKEYLATLISHNPQACFVIDQSYEFFTLRPLFSAAEAAEFPNVLLLHSMTKRYAVPGLRLGYVTGAPHLLHRLRTNRMPWSVNQLAIEAGLHLLEHDVPNPLDVASYLQEAARLRSALEALGGLEVWATETHFMLVCLRMGRASALKDYLAGEHGILIRDASNFDGLNEHFFRIAAQSREENDRLVKAIGQWLEEE
ncbi:MAG: aminotransferase class I/II-fold pyridoxal phosphate-dependent enzyme, partial [Bacteroides uniformis]|nr:aminotransferase class I/II-fold pyridoxal phosphate-dependent enzyme [Bacteroides uniformis]